MSYTRVIVFPLISHWILWVKIKNTTKLSYKPAYLLGPFILYCDVRAKDYESSYKIICSADKPVFQSNLQAQQKFIAELSLHHIKPRYVWIVDIVSQILFNKETKVTFEIVVGNSKASLKRKYDVMMHCLIKPAIFYTQDYRCIDLPLQIYGKYHDP